jgi:hypothetical protein
VQKHDANIATSRLNVRWWRQVDKDSELARKAS